MNRSATIFRPALLVCMSMLIAGCYTMLKHPSTDDGYEHSDFSRCTDCHVSYHHFDPYEPAYSDVWWDYYALPWWYDDVIVIDDEGEVPIRRAIHDMHLKFRDDPSVANPVGVKRTPPGGGLKEKKEQVGTREATEDTKTKIRKKTAPTSKQTSKRKSEDDTQDVKKKSDSGKKEL